MNLLRLTICAVLLSATSVSADVLKRIQEGGAINLGIRADAAPFSYLDQSTEASGLAVSLCEEVAREIGEELGVEDINIAHRVVTSSGRFNALISDQTDLHCGPASATLKRRETLDFSLIYYVDGAAVAARPGGYANLFDTRKGDVGVLDGTTTMATARDLIEQNNVSGELVKFPSHRRGLTALANGQIDLYVGDQAILLFQIEELGFEDKILVNEEVLSFEPYALAMKRGETGLRLAVDRALSRIYYDGRIFDMIQDALGDYPISPEVRAVYEIVGLPE